MKITDECQKQITNIFSVICFYVKNKALRGKNTNVISIAYRARHVITAIAAFSGKFVV